MTLWLWRRPDFYPKYLPWAFVTPCIAGAKENGKVSINLPWDGEASFFADVIGAVVLYIEGAKQTSCGGSIDVCRLRLGRVGTMSHRDAR